jgi:hypothetical protein
MPEAERKTIFKAERTMADYLRPLLQFIYPPMIRPFPKSLAKHVARLKTNNDKQAVASGQRPPRRKRSDQPS